MAPEQKLWQSVVYKALLDATHPGSNNNEQDAASRKARMWIVGAGRDFREVCGLAELDPDFISEKYRSGCVSHAALKKRDDGQ